MKIPEAWQHLPEAVRVKTAQAAWSEVIQEMLRFRATSKSSEAPIELRERSRAARRELEEAEAAFDAATGEPKSAGMTEAVARQVRNNFGQEQEAEVLAFLDTQCGRNLPCLRDVDAGQLEPIRLAVLELAHGDRVKLIEMVEAAKLDWKDVMLTAYHTKHPLDEEELA
jgi:hypothetical protein